jgi:6-methylpretetramide 4-monooxygenase
MTERTDVVIVGSGGGGAVLGLALAQMGIGFRVLERSRSPSLGVRSEILQPNGQAVLDRLGLLQLLQPPTGRIVRRFNFYRIGRGHLITVDYGVLPQPYNQAIIVDPEEINRLVVQAMEKLAPGSLTYGARFMRIKRRNGDVSGVTVEHGGRVFDLDAKLVVGADGARSSVRESLGIPTQMHSYRDAFIVTVLDDPEKLEEGQCFIGLRTILGFFPTGHGQVYIIYMIPAEGMQTIVQEGLDKLRTRWVAISPSSLW